MNRPLPALSPPWMPRPWACAPSSWAPGGWSRRPPWIRQWGSCSTKKIGDRVEQGEPLADFYTDNDPQKLTAARDRFVEAYEFSPEPVGKPRLLYARVDKDRVAELERG